MSKEEFVNALRYTKEQKRIIATAKAVVKQVEEMENRPANKLAMQTALRLINYELLSLHDTEIKFLPAWRQAFDVGANAKMTKKVLLELAQIEV